MKQPRQGQTSPGDMILSKMSLMARLGGIYARVGRLCRRVAEGTAVPSVQLVMLVTHGVASSGPGLRVLDQPIAMTSSWWAGMAGRCEEKVSEIADEFMLLRMDYLRKL